MKKITREQFAKAMKESVKEMGRDYVYPATAGCFYAKGGKPSCLIGHALYRCGVTIEQLIDFDIADDPVVGSTSAKTILSSLTDDRAVPMAALEAQFVQDTGLESWGTALDTYFQILDMWDMYDAE